MKKRSILFFALLCTQLLIFPKAMAQEQEPVIAAYYTNWSQYRPTSNGRPQFMPNQIDPKLLTDIYFAFAFFGYISKSVDPSNPRLTGDYKIQPVEWNDQTVLYPQLKALKQQNPKLRLHLSIGGWSFNDPEDPNGIGQTTNKLFSQMISKSANRQQFIKSALEYAKKYGFDGIDIDWEYPADSTRGGTVKDMDNYVTFLRELYVAVKAANPPLMLTWASPAIVPAGVPKSYHDNPKSYYEWIAKCSLYLDRLNVMSYDYHGAFDTNPQVTGVNSPLMRDTKSTSPLSIATTYNNYVNNGVPASKMIIGIPTYGRTFSGVVGLSSAYHNPGKPFTGPGEKGPASGTPGFLSYFELRDMIAAKGVSIGTDDVTNTIHAYNVNKKFWGSFDDENTVALKAKFAAQKKCQGIMFWAVDMDEYKNKAYPLIKSGIKAFKENRSSTFKAEEAVK